MERRYRAGQIAGQIYGYVVCLVAVITFLISVTVLVGAFFDLSDPLHARGFGYGEPSLPSYETYRMDILKSTREGQQPVAPSYVPDDETFRAMYEAAKADRIQSEADRIQSVRLEARQQLTVSGLLIVVCITLFTTHWTWVRRLARVEA